MRNLNLRFLARCQQAVWRQQEYLKTEQNNESFGTFILDAALTMLVFMCGIQPIYLADD